MWSEDHVTSWVVSHNHKPRACRVLWPQVLQKKRYFAFNWSCNLTWPRDQWFMWLLCIVVEWDSTVQVVTQIRDRLLKHFLMLVELFNSWLNFWFFSQDLKSLAECLESLAECLKRLAVCFETSTWPSISLKRVYENPVFKNHVEFSVISLFNLHFVNNLWSFP